MIKALVLAMGFVTVLWIINIYISRPIAKELGAEDVMFKKAVANGNNLFYCLITMGLIAVSYYWVGFLRWPILVLSGLFIISDLIALIFGAGAGLYLMFKEKESQKLEFTLMGSNFLGTLGEIIVFLLAAKYLFNWI